MPWLEVPPVYPALSALYTPAGRIPPYVTPEAAPVSVKLTTCARMIRIIIIHAIPAKRGKVRPADKLLAPASQGAHDNSYQHCMQIM